MNLISQYACCGKKYALVMKIIKLILLLQFLKIYILFIIQIAINLIPAVFAKGLQKQYQDYFLYSYFFIKNFFSELTHIQKSKLRKQILIKNDDIYQFRFQLPLINIFSDLTQINQVEINEEYLDGRNRQKFLQGYILQSYQSYLESNRLKKGKSGQSTFIYFSYISFLVEVERSKILSFVEMIRLKKKFNLSLREAAFQKQIFIKSKKNFEAINSREQNIQIQLKINKVGNQIKEKSIDPEMQNYFIGIQFDEEINQAENKYSEVLKLKEILLQQLCNDLINLTELKKTAEKYLNEKEQVLNMLIRLAKINYSSQKLQFYMENYCTYIGFGEHKRRLFNKKTLKNEQYYLDARNNAQKMNIDYKIFDKDNCVVFITLIDNVGTIRRVQNKFYNMFGYLEKETIGKNISLVMPSLIAKVHDQILNNFIHKGSSGKEFQQTNKSLEFRKKIPSITQQNQINNSINSDEKLQLSKNYIPLLLARNSQGWGVPIQLRFKSDYINMSDCGLTGHMKIVNKEYQYVMTSNKNYQVQLMSQLLFERVLSKYVSQNELNNIYLNNIIPILQYYKNQQSVNNFKESDDMNEIVKTLAFMPKHEVFSQKSLRQYAKTVTNTLMEKLDQRNLSKFINNFSIEKYDIYQVKIKVYYQKNEFNDFHIIEIQQIRKISSPDAQKENLQMFKNQLKVLLDIEYDISNDMEILKKLEQLTYLQLQLTNNDQQLELDQSYLSNIGDNDTEEENQKKDENQVFINILDTQNKQDNVLDPSKVTALEKLTFPDQMGQQIEKNQLQHDEFNESKLAFESSRRMLNQSQLYDTSHYNLDVSSQRGDKIINNYTSQEYLTQNFKTHNNLLLVDHLKDNQNSILDTLKEDGIEGRLEQYVKYYDQQQTASTNIHLNSIISNIPPSSESQRKQSSFQHIQSINHENFEQDKHQDNQSIINLLQEKLKQLKQLGKKMNKFGKQETNQKQKSIENLDSNPQQQQNQKIKKIKSIYKTLSNQISSQFSSSNLQNNYESQSSSHIQLQNFLKQYNNVPYSLTNNKLSWKNVDEEEQQIKRKNQAMNYIEGDKDYENQAAVCGSGVAENSSNFYSNSIEQNQSKQLQEIEERSRILDASSVKTGQTKNYEQKRNIRKMIITKKKDISLILLNVFGYLSIITITSLTVYQFANINNLFQQTQENIANIPWPNTLRACFSSPFYFFSMKYIALSKFFSDQTTLEPSFIAELENYSLKYLNNSMNLLKYYHRTGTTGKDYFKFINTNIVPYVISIDDKSIPQDQIYKSVPKYKASQNMTLESFVHRLVSLAYLYHKTEGLDPASQKIQLDNFSTFSLNLTSAQKLVELQSSDILYTIVDNIQQLMTVVITVSFVLIFALFPLYYFVQHKNQEVLKLLSTLTPLSLSQMLRQIQIALYLQIQNNVNASSKDKLGKLKNDAIRKRKNISQTTNIPKFRFTLFIICMISFCLIIIQPIVNKILVNQYNEEAQINIQLLGKILKNKQIINYINLIKIGKLYNLRVQCFSNVVVSLKYIQGKIYPTDTVYNMPYYFARAKSLVTTTNPSVIADVSNIIQQSQSQKKSQQSLYENFFYKLLDGNICQAVQDYPKFITEETKMDFIKCKSINQGIFTKGFQLSIKKFLGIFSDLYDIFLIKDNTQMKGALKAWEKNQKLRDFYDYFNYLEKVIILQKDFMLTVMKDDLDLIKKIQVILLVFQITQLMIIFTFGWLKFYLFVQKEMIQIRRILTVVSIDSVIENPYFISYLTK